MAISSVLKTNNPLLQIQSKQRFYFLHASSSPPFGCPTLTLRINICSSKPPAKKFCCRYRVSANSSSSFPKKLGFDGSNNVVVLLPCIKKESSGSAPHDHEESFADTTTRYQAMAAVAVLGSLLMFMVYGHLPALAASGRGAAGPSKSQSLTSSYSSSSSSSRFCDSEEDDYHNDGRDFCDSEEYDRHNDDHDCDYCPMEALNPSAAIKDRARNEVSETTCYCDRPAVIRTSWTDTNPGRRFRACTVFPWNGACRFFEWVDPPICPQHLNRRLLTRLTETGTLERNLDLFMVLCATSFFVRAMVDYWDIEREEEGDVGIAKSTDEG